MSELTNIHNDNDTSNKISLENFDSTKKKIRITSPHSILACELLGIKHDDLAFLTYDEYLQMNPDFQSLDQNSRIERYDHYNARREKIIYSLKKKRKDLIMKENDTNTNASDMNNITNYYNWIYRNEPSNNYNKTFHIFKKISLKKSASMGNIKEQNKSALILNGEEKLNKIRRRQKINIKLQIDYRLMQEQIRLQNLEKMKMKSENEKRIKMKKQDILMKRKMKDERRETEQKKRMENNWKILEEKRKEKIEKEKMKMLNERKRREEEERRRRIKFEEHEKKEK